MPFDQAAHEAGNREYEREAARAEALEARRFGMQRTPRTLPQAHQPGMVARFFLGFPFIGWLFGGLYSMYERAGLARTVRRGQHPLGGRLPPKVHRVKFDPPRGGKFALARQHAGRRFPGYPGMMARGLKHRRPR